LGRLHEIRDRQEEVMAGRNIAVFGIYPHRASFVYALGALKNLGFRDTDVSVPLQENSGTKDLVTQKATKAPEGAAAGAGSGTVVGGAIGWLAGTGALAIPGLGPFLVAGRIVVILAGIGVGGTLGGLTRSTARTGIA
jgi:hypothetical protein